MHGTLWGVDLKPLPVLGLCLIWKAFIGWPVAMPRSCSLIFRGELDLRWISHKLLDIIKQKRPLCFYSWSSKPHELQFEVLMFVQGKYFEHCPLTDMTMLAKERSANRRACRDVVCACMCGGSGVWDPWVPPVHVEYPAAWNVILIISVMPQCDATWRLSIWKPVGNLHHFPI